MFVDAALVDYKVWVSERNRDGVRNIRKSNPPHVFYYEDRDGPYKAFYDDNVKLKRSAHTSGRAFKAALELKRVRGVQCYETDVDPVLRYLEEKYPNDDDLPPLHVGFLDIEVEQVEANGELFGGSRPTCPMGQVTAITLYQVWDKTAITLATPPPGMTMEEARALLDQRGNPDGFGPLGEDAGYILVENERELLYTLLNQLEDVDVISGWNSEFYDLPYLINRVRVVFGGEDPHVVGRETGDQMVPFKPSADSEPYLQMFNLFPRLPRLMMKEKFGTLEPVYKLFGRVHLDYQLLFMKFTKNTLGEFHSYSLDYVLNRVVQQSKVHYDGSLDDLRKNRFRTFIAYNRQDTMGLNAIEEKLTILDQANTMAHMAGVPLDKVLGSVVIIEAAIMRRLHRSKRICFDKPPIGEKSKIPGAFVVDPQSGMYDWVVSFDIASLYPSIIRMLNISPETMVGQFLTPTTDRIINDYMNGDPELSTEAWSQVTGVEEYHRIVEGSDELFTIEHYEIKGKVVSKGQETRTGAEWRDWIKENNYAISANGTVFDMSRWGIVAECINDWFFDRIESKKKAGNYEKKLAALKKEWAGKEIPAEIATEIHNLNKLASKWNTVQMAKKIFMNSTYGAFLNQFFRFFDPRLGKSVTLSGRVITKHMIKKTSEVITGNYEFDRNAIIYGDTDSCYAKLDWFIKQYPDMYEGSTNHKDPRFKAMCDVVIETADEMGKDINDSFVDFSMGNFFVNLERAKAIEAVRDVVAPRGLFKNAKKRYALWVVNVEGKPKDEIKIMGMETRRTDTPRVIQQFIEIAMEKVLKEGAGYQEVYDYVQDYRNNVYRKQPLWSRGTPQRVSNITGKAKEIAQYEASQAKGMWMAKKPNIHFSIMAALNTNKLIRLNGDTRWDLIRDGDKIEILQLKRNEYDFKTVAIKVGETYIPDWFQQLPFDRRTMEQKTFDKKIFNTLGEILEWDFTAEDNYSKDVFVKKDFF